MIRAHALTLFFVNLVLLPAVAACSLIPDVSTRLGASAALFSIIIYLLCILCDAVRLVPIPLTAEKAASHRLSCKEGESYIIYCNTLYVRRQGDLWYKPRASIQE